jgi:anti-sigma B factor antagonist
MTEPPIDVVAEHVGDWHVLHVHGEIDGYTAPVLRKAFTEAVGKGNTNLIIDLSGVPFIDSAGLSVLISARRVVGLAEGRLRLVTAVPATLRLLRMTRLDDVFDVRPNLQSAQTDNDSDPR